MKYLSNTLQNDFGLHPDTHSEFSKLFRENCKYLGIGEGFSAQEAGVPPAQSDKTENQKFGGSPVVTLAEPAQDSKLQCFVIMPFTERDGPHAKGFFNEVLQSLIVPAGREAGFTVRTANRQGSDVIQSTIVNDLLEADLVVGDLTEHNPNVLFELGLRIREDKPVALIRARGTPPIFDVDHMMRVFDYDPCLWASTIEHDVPKLMEHIKATWENRKKASSYLKILRRQS
jgi:hypothetical protein